MLDQFMKLFNNFNTDKKIKVEYFNRENSFDQIPYVRLTNLDNLKIVNIKKKLSDRYDVVINFYDKKNKVVYSSYYFVKSQMLDKTEDIFKWLMDQEQSSFRHY